MTARCLELKKKRRGNDMDEYKICYKPQRFNTKSKERLERILEIIDKYEAAGAVLNLRQLFYQLVSKNYIPNKQSEYNALSTLVVNARKGGLISWTQIVDETRELQYRQSWKSPTHRIECAAASHHIDYWQQQKYYIEVWVEKLALLSVIEQAAYPLDVPYYTNRGFNSVSESWAAS